MNLKVNNFFLLQNYKNFHFFAFGASLQSEASVHPKTVPAGPSAAMH